MTINLEKLLSQPDANIPDLSALWCSLQAAGQLDQAASLASQALELQLADHAFCVMLCKASSDTRQRLQAAWQAVMLQPETQDYFRLRRLKRRTWSDFREHVLSALKTLHAPAVIVRLLLAEQELSEAMFAAGNDLAAWRLIQAAYPEMVRSLPKSESASLAIRQPPSASKLPPLPELRVRSLPFEQARELARAQYLKTRSAYRAWVRAKQPPGLPAFPELVYRQQGWISWEDWLGTRVADLRQRLDFLPFTEARELIQSLDIKNVLAFRAWVRSDQRHPGIPASPDYAYRDAGWTNWGDFLGTGSISTTRIVFKSFEAAREYVRSLGLPNRDSYQEWAWSYDRPDDIPSNPDKTYRDKGWTHWNDYLGTTTFSTRQVSLRSFAEARAYVQTLGLQSERAYRLWSKSAERPADIPSNPHRQYRGKGWVSWPDWFGKDAQWRKKTVMPFAAARERVKAMGFTSSQAYCAWAKTSERDPMLPATPHVVYQASGWISWGDFLGTGKVSPAKATFRAFAQAREYVRPLGFRDRRAYQAWAHHGGGRPADIPSAPDRIYHEAGWTSWSDYLGNEDRVRVPRPSRMRDFALARTYVRALSLSCVSDYQAWAVSPARPVDIPADPSKIYLGKGWVNWSDWLGTPARRGKFKDFASARAAVHALGLTSAQAYQAWSSSGQRPAEIPADPRRVYMGKGWAGWTDWIGQPARPGPFRNFEAAREYIRTLKLRSLAAYHEWSASPARLLDIPAYPNEVYAGKGWVNWADWLGAELKPHNRNFLPFAEARELARSLGLAHGAAYRAWANSPERLPGLPVYPSEAYAGQGWAGWPDWLAQPEPADKFKAFAEARAHVHTLKLASMAAYKAWYADPASPAGFPSNPDKFYAGQGWVDTADWLGTPPKRWVDNRPDFDVLRARIRALKLGSVKAFWRWQKQSAPELPARPDVVYRDVWQGWRDFLGTDVSSP
jgi:hypothetical protein